MCECQKWMDIETAPKDVRVLLWFPNLDAGAIVIGHWKTDRYAKKPRPYWSSDWEDIFGILGHRNNPPTHWQRLPEPPNPLSGTLPTA